MKLIIDRFEGEYAVCEDEQKNMVNILKSYLPDGVKEGAVLISNGDSISVDYLQTNERASEIKKLMEDLWDK
jgi:hypothetical protein